MDSPSVKPSGWRSFGFDFATQRKIEPVPGIPQQCDGTCKQEQVECGCFRTVVDYEKMDQQ